MNFIALRLRTLALAVVLAVVGAVLLSGCGGGGGGSSGGSGGGGGGGGGGSNSPSAVAKVFQAALVKGDMETAGKNCTPEMLGMLAPVITQIQAHETGRGKMAITGEAINGDKAEVAVKYDNGESDTISLVKADGKWKVHGE